MNQRETLDRAQYLYELPEDDEEDFSEDEYDYGYSDIYEEY